MNVLFLTFIPCILRDSSILEINYLTRSALSESPEGADN